MKCKALFTVFLVCWAYWLYLIFASQMSIKFDAADYEFIGSIIHQKGWIEFFKTGPHREPLYPLAIAVSMKIADSLSISHYTVQKVIQVLILFATQLLALGLLRRLKIRESVQWVTLLYMGFSPAIVNSTFSLFGEIITYPFVLIIVLLSVLSWRAVFIERLGRVVQLAVLTAGIFILATFGKGVFQYIFWAYLSLFGGLFLYGLVKRDIILLKHAAIYILLAFMIFSIPIGMFKSANKKYNSNYAFTNRFADLLFGNAVKRTKELPPKMILAHIASIPGAGVCRLFFTGEECLYCEFQTADYYRGTLLGELKTGIPPEKITGETISFAIKKAAERPFQYLLLSTIESLRMPFWESAHLGNVVYPVWLQRIYDWGVFKNSLRLLMSLATYLSLFFLLVFLIKNRRQLVDFKSANSERVQIGFFVFFLVFVYTALHSLFSIVTRYALPISFLYLLGIAFFVEQRIFHKREPSC